MGRYVVIQPESRSTTMKTKRHLRSGDRVKVTEPNEENEPLRGKAGTIIRLKTSGHEAWVDMVEELPESLAVFPSVTDPRHRQRCFYLSELELA
jgi:hypothetical protein